MTETTSQAISLVDPYAEHFAKAEQCLAAAADGVGDALLMAVAHSQLANSCANRDQAKAETRLSTTVANGEGGNTGRVMVGQGR